MTRRSGDDTTRPPNGWDDFKRAVRPLRRVKTGPEPPPAADHPPRQTPRQLMRPAPAAQPPKITVNLLPEPSVDDPQLLQHLRQGKVRIEARLDLHHHTESAAYQAVMAFLNKAQQQRWRILLIITGQGAVLQQALPRWLRESQQKQVIRWCAPAASRHGGAGAYYIVLRRS